MKQQSGAQRPGAAKKKPGAARRRPGTKWKRSGASAAGGLIVVLAVVIGVAMLAYGGDLRNLLRTGAKTAVEKVTAAGIKMGDATVVPADQSTVDAVDNGHPDAVDASDSSAPDAGPAAAGDVTDRDDGHWRDRRRDDWQDPCWTRDGAFGKKPSPGNDARSPVDLCDVDMPFPMSVGFEMKKTAGGVGYIELNGGEWECLERDQPDGEIWNCGEIHVSDVAWVDIDRDGKNEAVVYFMSNHGGNCEEYQIYAYEVGEKQPRFKAVVADNDAYSCDERSVSGVEPYGKHCVKVLTNCEKPCHGCEGTPCYEIFAWTGKRFEVAQTWIDANQERGIAADTETNEDLLRMCVTP